MGVLSLYSDRRLSQKSIVYATMNHMDFWPLSLFTSGGSHRRQLTVQPQKSSPSDFFFLPRPIAWLCTSNPLFPDHERWSCRVVHQLRDTTLLRWLNSSREVSMNMPCPNENQRSRTTQAQLSRLDDAKRPRLWNTSRAWALAIKACRKRIGSVTAMREWPKKALTIQLLQPLNLRKLSAWLVSSTSQYCKNEAPADLNVLHANDFRRIKAVRTTPDVIDLSGRLTA